MDENKRYSIDSLVVGEMQINCYLFSCNATGHSAIIDPGGDAGKIEAAAEVKEVQIKMILLTHGHFDHIGAVSEIRKKYNCPVLIHRSDQETLTNPMVNLSALTGANILCDPADRLLED